MNRAKGAAFWADAAAGAEISVNARFAVGCLEDAFFVHAIHGAEPCAEVVATLVRVAFVFFDDRDAWHCFREKRNFL